MIAFAIAVAACTSPAWAADEVPASWLGTWTLNIGKSAYDPGPAPYRRATFTIERRGDGLKATYDFVYPRGGVSHLEWIGKIDGQEYPVQGVEEHITYAYSAASDGSHTVVVRFDGRVTANSTVVVSPDGKTMTTTTVGRNALGRPTKTVTVYEKQAQPAYGSGG